MGVFAFCVNVAAVDPSPVIGACRDWIIENNICSAMILMLRVHLL